MGLSVEAKAKIAELWAAGAPAWKIREEAGVSRHAVLRQVRRLRTPHKPEPVRSELRRSLAEREEISRGLAAGESLRSIARRVGRAPSTISREVNRNGGRVRYRACPADRAFGRRCKRPKPAKLASCERLRVVVEDRLEQRWSPEQIAGWLRVNFPDDPEMRVSHETIYLSLFVQSRGALRKELTTVPAHRASHSPAAGLYDHQWSRPASWNGAHQRTTC